MNNHKLFFYFPVEQKKHIDLGTFLPHQVYVIQTSNVFAVPSRRIGFSILNELRAIKIMLKCIIAGYQGIPENYNSNETVQLFRVGNEYAWGDLKIFSFQMQEGRTIVADMIPVLHNCCPCFYDKIRQRYFYFQGSDSVCYE